MGFSLTVMPVELGPNVLLVWEGGILAENLT
jgi:hypothetical protein